MFLSLVNKVHVTEETQLSLNMSLLQFAYEFN